MRNNKIVGEYCEKLATKFLIDSGKKIVAKNFRVHFGEIDIIFLDGEFIVFGEVKHIGKTGLESLSKSVDSYKRETIIKVATYFLYSHAEYENLLIRFDIFGIDADKNRVVHIENAFGENVLT